MGCPRLGHHLGFKVASVHCLQVGYDGRVREVFTKCAHGTQPVGQQERRAGFEPIYAASQGHCRSLYCLVKIDQIERYLNGWFVHSWCEVWVKNLRVKDANAEPLSSREKN